MKRLARKPLALATATSILLASSGASAASAADQAAAEALFAEGKRLSAAGDLARACPKFAESNRLDPGSGTLLNLGACYEQSGRLASAWGAFKEAEATARAAGDGNRQSEAARRADALAPRLPRLTIDVPVGARVPGLEVRRDGALIGDAQWGSPIPTDPGVHTIAASAPGYSSWSTVTQVGAAGSVATVSVPPLAADGGSLLWKRIGIGALALGGAGLIVGAVTLGVDASKHSTLVKECPGDACSPSMQSAVSSYHTFGVVSTTSLIAGGVVGLAGAGLLIASSTGAFRRMGFVPLVGPRFAGALVRFP